MSIEFYDILLTSNLSNNKDLLFLFYLMLLLCVYTALPPPLGGRMVRKREAETCINTLSNFNSSSTHQPG